MPICNVYIIDEDSVAKLAAHTEELRQFLARTLSSKDTMLTPQEISLRVIINKLPNAQIGSVEAEVFAYSFPERVQKQDIICRDVARYFEATLNLQLQSVQCWLILSELGHSWEGV